MSKNNKIDHPTPWRVQENRHSGYIYIVDDNDTYICTFCRVECDTKKLDSARRRADFVVDAVNSKKERNEMNETKHTPTPWRVCGGATPHYKAIHSQDGYIVYQFASDQYDKELGEPIKCPNWEVQAVNAEFMVHAVNVHDDLVKALKMSLFSARYLQHNVSRKDSHRAEEIIRIIDEALDKAKER